jgi:hypothetical protein
MTETRANPSRYNHIPVRLSETSPKIDRYDITRLDTMIIKNKVEWSREAEKSSYLLQRVTRNL